MFRILVPVDFEEGTSGACHYALRLAAAAPQAEVLLLHCFRDYLAGPWHDPVDQSGHPVTGSEDATNRVLQRNETEERGKLEALRQELRSNADGSRVLLSTAFVNGLPEDVIPVEAQRFQADLIVMGTAGEGSLSRSLFGTVTTKMAADANVPVLSVPQQGRALRLGRVLYATDFDDADAQAIADLHQLLAPFNPHILCLHITYGAATAQDQEKLNQLEAAVKDVRPAATNIRYSLLEGSSNVDEALESFVENERVDLLAVTNRKRTFLDSILHPSLTKQLVLEAEVPLLIFHSRFK
ncbi:universal stress protein [Pontibacter russatus]|uniref:universal stress protein n=1 Tax=Pontibacter russatus TaxID=2694929 RepID=UPI00137B4C4E|nr:universal stress protein [Pontibacter russatus]